MNLRNKRLYAVVGLVGMVICLGVVVTAPMRRPVGDNTVCVAHAPITNGGRFTQIGAQQCTLSLEVVNTEAGRQQGLSGRESMPSERGMLFVFDRSGQQCMWMKDTKFPLDILWLNGQGIITKVEKNLTPDTYPQTYCQDNTYFVIEVNAGVSGIPELQLGAHVNL